MNRTNICSILDSSASEEGQGEAVQEPSLNNLHKTPTPTTQSTQQSVVLMETQSVVPNFNPTSRVRRNMENKLRRRSKKRPRR